MTPQNPSVRRRSALASGALVAVGAVAGAVVMMAGGFGGQQAALPQSVQLRDASVRVGAGASATTSPTSPTDPRGTTPSLVTPKIVQHHGEVVSEASDSGEAPKSTPTSAPAPSTSDTSAGDEGGGRTGTTAAPGTTHPPSTTTTPATTTPATTTTRPKSGGGDDRGDSRSGGRDS